MFVSTILISGYFTKTLNIINLNKQRKSFLYILENFTKQIFKKAETMISDSLNYL